ncbi:MAG: transcription elongation factor GreA, partial [Salibacteraceae bacterium]
MSRGFVKEDDQEEPPFIPPRASLPEGVENYVTADGLRELKEERKTLIESRKNSNSLSERDRRREQTIIDTQINQLDERIQSAKVVEPLNNPSQVRFGTTVSFVNTKTP